MEETSPSSENSSSTDTLTLETQPISMPTSETSANKPSGSTGTTQETESREPTLTPLGDIRRNPPGLWKPGQSGNPAGRPKGSKNQITQLRLALEQVLREDAADHMHDVLMKCIQMAKKGHPGMIKLLLELHMSKHSDVDDRGVDDKITININSMDTPSIDITPNKEN